ncbi:MAG: folylpolyglutamate synthase/dihydrofolate synthase family protein [Ignavibacteriaceae bacterium]
MKSEYKEIEAKIFELHKLGVKFGLENTVEFLRQIGNPHERLKCFHIAGSNGKGSTASFIASILAEEGYKTGLYMSPHFIRFNERIKVNGEEISDEYIADFFSEYEDYITRNKITFFEFTTVLTFKYFADFPVDYAVIEAGLGGRLDSTNVVTPLASIITSISLEHTNILGNTIEEITREKGAIIKPGSKVFTGLIPDTAKRIIEERCDELKVEYFPITDFTIKRETYLELYTEELTIDKLDSPLKGFYQKYNAALAVLVLNKTLDLHNLTSFLRGLKYVVKNTSFQGRYEIYSEIPKVIMDSAHNPEGVYHFMDEFKKETGLYRKNILLFSALRDKNITDMVKNLSGTFDEIYVTQINFERSSTTEELEKIFSGNPAYKGIPIKAVTDHTAFIKKYMADEENRKNSLVILGSMYLLGEVKKGLLAISGN